MSDAPQRADPRFRRHLLVLLALTLVAAVGIALVVTGHRSSRVAATTTTAGLPATSAPIATLRSLGQFATDAALRDAVRGLDPATLRPKAGSAPTTAGPSTTLSPLPPVTTQSLARCTSVLTHTSERPLGSMVSSASAIVGSTPVVVATFHLPATKSDP
ncbi:MAG TPA: hypothetical protein VID05_02755, partial [Acidimicrobiales bacterium]